jgi:hypothetical protein
VPNAPLYADGEEIDLLETPESRSSRGQNMGKTRFVRRPEIRNNLLTSYFVGEFKVPLEGLEPPTVSSGRVPARAEDLQVFRGVLALGFAHGEGDRESEFHRFRSVSGAQDFPCFQDQVRVYPDSNF